MMFRTTPELPVQQLAILSICRFAEPVALTGVFPYMPEMIESFNVPKEEVAYWAGLTSAVFSLSQCVTAMFWVRASDRYGRKPVILASLICAMTTTILYGFSQNLTWALIARTLAGASNGNVGIIRTTGLSHLGLADIAVAELVPQKELQPRAFSVMPLVWSIGSIFGPILGGALASPAKRYPDLFGKNDFLERFPFALPNLVAAILFCVGVGVGILYLRETLESKKNEKDYGLILGSFLKGSFKRKRKVSWPNHNDQGSPLLTASLTLKARPVPATYREVFSYQSNINLLTYSMLSLHAVAYDQLVPVFLHLPVHDRDPKSFLKFAGGFGLDSGAIGKIFTIYGIFCMVVQFFLFPPLARRFGSLRCLRTATFLFPVAYIVTPFTVLLPTSTTRQIAVFAAMLIKGTAGVFAYPCSTILMTNSARSIAVLGMLNGVAVSSSAVARALGPSVSGTAFSWGIDIGYIVLPWWILAIFGGAGFLCTFWLVEMDGFKNEADSNRDVAGEEAIPLVGAGTDDTGAEVLLEDKLDQERRKSFAIGEDIELGPEEDDLLLDGPSTTTSSGSTYLAAEISTAPPRMRSPMRSKEHLDGMRQTQFGRRPADSAA